MEPYGLTYFCDDIRFEQQNKFSLIGCYGSELFLFEKPPVSLPKLGLMIQVRMPPTKSPALKLIVYPSGKDEPIFAHEIAEEKDFQAPPPTPAPGTNEPPAPQRILMLPLILSPFVIEQLGFVRVRMLYGTKTIRLGALEIKHQEPVAPSA